MGSKDEKFSANKNTLQKTTVKHRKPYNPTFQRYINIIKQKIPKNLLIRPYSKAQNKNVWAIKTHEMSADQTQVRN